MENKARDPQMDFTVRVVLWINELLRKSPPDLSVQEREYKKLLNQPLVAEQPDW